MRASLYDAWMAPEYWYAVMCRTFRRHDMSDAPLDRAGLPEVPAGDGGVHVGALVLQARQERGQVVHRFVEVQELELGAHATEPTARFVVDARTRGTRIQLGQAVVGGGERVEHRPREEAVEEQELHCRRGVDRVPVGAEVRLVRRAAAQRRGPPGAAERVAVTRAQQSRRHVGALQAAPDREETPAVVTAHGGVDDAVARGSTVAHPTEELVARGSGAGPGPAADLAVRGVERLPQLRRQRLACAACVLPRRADRAGDGAGEGEVLREQRGDGGCVR